MISVYLLLDLSENNAISFTQSFTHLFYSKYQQLLYVPMISRCKYYDEQLKGIT